MDIVTYMYVNMPQKNRIFYRHSVQWNLQNTVKNRSEEGFGAPYREYLCPELMGIYY